MPIRFRCTSCRQLLSVSRRKAGTAVNCPACNAGLHVPTLESFSAAGEKPSDESSLASAANVAEVTRRDEPLPESLSTGEPESVFGSPSERMIDGHAEPAEDHWAGDRHSAGYIDPWSPDAEDHEAHVGIGKASKVHVKDEADMTSMVDVTFLLLVFFMVTASFTVDKALRSQPPEPEAGGAAAPQSVTMDDLAAESVMVEVGVNDTLVVDDVPVSGPVELRAVLDQKILTEGKTELVIEAEYMATHGMVVAVQDVAMQAGMQRVRRLSRAKEQ